ncbi:MAG: ABC transporter substrate-binding protein [Bdellovibrionaceae bacterium]|nr:ABC transporter substrate-binding protein [Pseudobdellovibrionaceae bacterium]
MNIERLRWRILLGRLLTRSGDQAWDFAVPLALLRIFPDQIRIAAAYYLIVRMGHVILLPRLSVRIDRMSRWRVAQAAISMQFLGVLGAAVVMLGFPASANAGLSASVTLAFASGLVAMGLIASLGSTLMDISIANDLVPAAVPPSELASLNSRMRQLDLLTEVMAPVIAGALLLVSLPGLPLLGFGLIALWNLLSFFPELFLLRSVFHMQPDLLKLKVAPTATMRMSLWEKFVGGWRQFFRQPVAPAILCYAALWMSVLSPHGVLLTGFLKDGWDLDEVTIGLFRGAGAFFGLFATFVYPRVIQSKGLLRGSRGFVVFQALMVVLAVVGFFAGGRLGQIGFLVCILLSRIGLYGFSLGETQIRQVGIGADVRGEVNGFAAALTALATLGLYGAGALLPSTQDFSILVVSSALFVILAAVRFSMWSAKTQIIDAGH